MATRISFTLADRNHERVVEIATKSDQDVSTFVRNAINTYLTIQEEHLKGVRVYLGRDNKIEKELVLP